MTQKQYLYGSYIFIGVCMLWIYYSASGHVGSIHKKAYTWTTYRVK